MTLNFENESDRQFGFDPEKIASAVCRATLEAVRCPYEAEVSLLITDGEQIREMNRTYRGIDRETDVLSFPLQEYDAPGSFERFEDPEIQSDAFDPDSGELLLGDIVICADRVASQAREYGHSEKREFAFLVAHSMLHLTGYDHMEAEEREVMEDMQRKIMDMVQIPRDFQNPV